MKAPVLLPIAAALVLAGWCGAAHPAVLISEMCDPRLNYATDRFIEIYNAGDTAVDLAGWSLVAVGNNVDCYTWPLSGTIAPGQALVAGNSTTVAVFPIDFPGAGWSGSNGNWNGKVGDGAKLVDASATVVDYAVVGGTAFENCDYVRRPGVSAPSPAYDPAQWTATPVDLASDASPGSHNTGPAPPGPAITQIHTDPAYPEAGVEVDVFADVADTAAVTSVQLAWGTSSASLPNTIDMLPVAGDTYGTEIPLPGLPAGTTVYFRITATNDLPASTVSDLESYSLPVTLTIHEIQGEATSSPYAGQLVLTRGVVTASFPSYFALQDGAGAWNGVWVQSAVAPAVGDSVAVRGQVAEAAGSGYAGNTLIANALLVSDVPGGALPEAMVIPSGSLSAEAYEGVLVRLVGARCTDPTLGAGEWAADDGSGAARVDDLGHGFTPTLGTEYDITGPVTYHYGSFKLEPRGAADIAWAGDDFAPAVFHVAAMSDTTLLVTFTEPVAQAGAETAANYAIAGLTVLDAARDPGHPEQVLLAVTAVPPGEHTLAVDDVEDLYGNAAAGSNHDFRVIDTSVPAGYYDTALGLAGEALKAALHGIIRDHTVCSYDYAWTAYRTTDVKPNGRVWDVYSDIPGGTPPYEYAFGVDEGGIGLVEGEGYTREHTWPKSWFGGTVSPMYSDLFILYPCDADVNGNRGAYPYGEVAAPEWTSLNGSLRGPSSYPGYTGTVFEPIDAFKGDLARAYFYMSTRYYTEDALWPGGPMTDGAELLPWAAAMLLEWHQADPVSKKEIDRNGAIYELQHNRNPFVDHPEFAAFVFDPTPGVDAELPAPAPALERAAPNPFRAATVLAFSLPAATAVRVEVFDLRGRTVACLASGVLPAGRHTARWDGRDAGGEEVGPGVYIVRLTAGGTVETRKVVRMR